MRMVKAARMLAATVLVAFGMPAWGDERPACERFDWSVAAELAWFRAMNLPSIETGEVLSAMPERGLALRLKPAVQAKLAAPASHPSRLEAPRSGVVTFDVPAIGLYQVTISSDGWLDVIQNGAALPAESHTGNRDCVGLRKSVRFKLQPGSVTIQVTGVPADVIGMGIRRVD